VVFVWECRQKSSTAQDGGESRGHPARFMKRGLRSVVDRVGA
jgi:hypothetical protein